MSDAMDLINSISGFAGELGKTVQRINAPDKTKVQTAFNAFQMDFDRAAADKQGYENGALNWVEGVHTKGLAASGQIATKFSMNEKEIKLFEAMNGEYAARWHGNQIGQAVADNNTQRVSKALQPVYAQLDRAADLAYEASKTVVDGQLSQNGVSMLKEADLAKRVATKYLEDLQAADPAFWTKELVAMQMDAIESAIGPKTAMRAIKDDPWKAKERLDNPLDRFGVKNEKIVEGLKTANTAEIAKREAAIKEFDALAMVSSDELSFNFESSLENFIQTGGAESLMEVTGKKDSKDTPSGSLDLLERNYTEMKKLFERKMVSPAVVHDALNRWDSAVKKKQAAIEEVEKNGVLRASVDTITAVQSAWAANKDNPSGFNPENLPRVSDFRAAYTKSHPEVVKDFDATMRSMTESAESGNGSGLTPKDQANMIAGESKIMEFALAGHQAGYMRKWVDESGYSAQVKLNLKKIVNSTKLLVDREDVAPFAKSVTTKYKDDPALGALLLQRTIEQAAGAWADKGEAVKGMAGTQNFNPAVLDSMFARVEKNYKDDYAKKLLGSGFGVVDRNATMVYLQRAQSEMFVGVLDGENVALARPFAVALYGEAKTLFPSLLNGVSDSIAMFYDKHNEVGVPRFRTSDGGYLTPVLELKTGRDMTDVKGGDITWRRFDKSGKEMTLKIPAR